MRWRRLLLEANLAARRVGGQRMRPSLFIVGAQKAGTTTLHGLLADHPQVKSPLVKELHYFDVAADRPEAWYLAHFPRDERIVEGEGEALTFDTTPYYMFHPHVAGRIASFAPGARIIALLRDPVGRAWSHYWHEWARGFEKLPPMEAFMAEPERVPDPHRSVGNTAEQQFAHQHFSYCARSEYDLQLGRWFDAFPPENILVLRSETLFEKPRETLDRVSAFLKIKPFATVDNRALNSGGYAPPPEEVESWLRARLAKSSAATRAMLGDEFSW